MRTAYKKSFTVVGCAAALGVLVSAAPAVQAAAAPGELKVSFQEPQAVAGSERSRVAGACSPGENRYNRTQSCAKASSKVDIIRNGRLEGTIRFAITQAVQLHTGSRDFSEKYTFKVTGIAGRASAVTAALDVACPGSCRATNHVSGPRAVRAGTVISGPVNYHESTTTLHRDRVKYTLTFRKPGYSTSVSNWKSLTFRCDKGNKASKTGNFGTGCVFPGYDPTEVKQAALPEISKNISRIQKAGPHHYGAYALHGSPLHRTISTAERKDNRRIACKGHGTPPRGKSCDEYPFASTKEGAANRKGKPGDWGWAWVPVSEQDQQRDILRDFYRENRILGGDRFWVAVP
ncbi:NucA/NucB deoxyribonuclease domain-containing protein [Streptomyces tubercidicus]